MVGTESHVPTQVNGALLLFAIYWPLNVARLQGLVGGGRNPRAPFEFGACNNSLCAVGTVISGTC